MSISILARFSFAACLLHAASAQTPSRAVRELVVMVNGRSSGTGVIVGQRDGRLYVLTAAHVAGLRGATIEVVTEERLGGTSLTCSVLGSEWQEPPTQDPAPDLAIAECQSGRTRSRALAYDVTGSTVELTRGAPLTIIANFSFPFGSRTTHGTGWDVPLGYFLFDKAYGKGESAVIEFYNPLKLDLRGASGGPLMTDRSEIIGFVFQFGELAESSVRAVEWTAAQSWVAKQKCEHCFQLRRRARTAASLGRTNVDVAVSATSLYVQNFGWLAIVPRFRIGTTLPNVPGLGVALDFTYSKGRRTTGGGIETLNFTVPAITGQWNFGAVLRPLRGHELLGGFYAAAGLAPVSFQRTLTNTLERADIRAWSYVFDMGWRYRLPRRSWGFATSYREAVSPDSSAQELYPRFRAVEYGVYVVLK